MLTGEVPMGRFEPPSKRVQVDVRLDEVVLHALEREPARRYQQAGEIKTGVETIAATMKPSVDGARGIDPESEARPVPALVTFRRFGILFLAAFAIFAVILGVMAVERQRQMRAASLRSFEENKPTPAAGENAKQDNPAPTIEAPHEVKLKFVSVDSEETSAQHGYGENAVDGDPNTYWHTQWKDRSPGLPHEIIIELVPPSTIKGFTYLPPQVESDHGYIRDYEFYVSNDGTNFGPPVKKGSFKTGKEIKTETFEPIKCRFIKLKAISEINGLPWTSAAEIGVIQ
jgi:hypothetical protein